MLRSLVGSEMCIRDRRTRASGHSVRRGRHRREAEPRTVAQSTRSDHVRACLLYTSDAADDLLCVDLGGRRIIKNKNTTTTAPDVHH